MDDVKQNELILLGSRYKKLLSYQNVKRDIIKLKDIFIEIKNGIKGNHRKKRECQKL